MTAGIEAWAQTCVERMTALVLDGLPRALRPAVELTGDAHFQRAGYHAQAIGFEHRERGRLSLWLYVAPPEHAYSAGVKSSTVAAGLKRTPQDLLAHEDAEGWFAPDNPFQWRRLDAAAGMRLPLLADTSSGPRDPVATAEEFAPRVLDGLRQAGFFPPS
jgi:hypothetical protein